MLLDNKLSQLVLVDYQEKLMPAMLNAEMVLANALRLAQAAHLLGVPTWGTEQCPQKLGSNAPGLRALCRQTIAKTSFSATYEGLLELLSPKQAHPTGNARSLPRHLQKKQEEPTAPPVVVIAGCEAHICLLQTALELIEEGCEVWVVTDACSSRSEANRDAAFDRLAGVGAELVSTEMVLFEWLRSADHPHFKAIQALVK